MEDHQQLLIILGATRDTWEQLSLHGTMVEEGQQHPLAVDHTQQMDISLHGAAGVHHQDQGQDQDLHQALLQALLQAGVHLHQHLQKIEIQVNILLYLFMKENCMILFSFCV